MFIETGFNILRKQGVLGYITPDTFLRKDDHLPLRKVIFHKFKVLELIECGPLFSKVRDTWCLVFAMERSNPVKSHQILHRKISRFIVSVEERLRKFGNQDWDNEDYVHQLMWLENPNIIVGYKTTEREQKIITKMDVFSSLAKLRNIYCVSRGEEGSKFALKEHLSSNFYMVIPKDVSRYTVDTGLSIKNQNITQGKLNALYLHPKIWIIRIQKMRWQQRIVCGLDIRTNSAGMKTLQVIVSPSDDIEALKYLQGILASKLINFWATNYLTDDMNKTYLEKLPIRTIDFNKSSEKALHDKMVSLVEKMLGLNKKLQKAKIAHEKELLERQIKITDNRIDSLVYKLYGLTEEEIKVVEET